MNAVASMRNFALPPGYTLGQGVTSGDSQLFGTPTTPSAPAGAQSSSSSASDAQKAPLSRLADRLLSDLLSLQGIG